MKSLRDAAVLLVLLTLAVSVRVTPAENVDHGLVPDAAAATKAAPPAQAAIPLVLEPAVADVETAEDLAAGGKPVLCPKQRKASHRVERRGDVLIIEIERDDVNPGGVEENCIHDTGGTLFTSTRTAC